MWKLFLYLQIHAWVLWNLLLYHSFSWSYCYLNFLTSYFTTCQTINLILKSQNTFARVCFDSTNIYSHLFGDRDNRSDQMCDVFTALWETVVNSSAASGRILCTFIFRRLHLGTSIVFSLFLCLCVLLFDFLFWFLFTTFYTRTERMFSNDLFLCFCLSLWTAWTEWTARIAL